MLKEKVNILLKRQNKALKELCSAIGISDTGLRKIFARDSCELSLLRKMASFFEVPIYYFLDEDNSSLSTVQSTAGNHSPAISGNGNNIGANNEMLEKAINTIANQQRTINEQTNIISRLIAKK